MQIWFVWFKHRWQAISALGIALLAFLLVVLMITGTSTLGMTFLGHAGAPRAAAADGPSGTVLPRSSDVNQSTSALPDLNTSLLDQAIAADTGPHTVAEAQATWSATEMEQHQTELLAAMNCVRQQHRQRALTLDPHLSATAGDAWLKLSRDRSFSLMSLPGRFALRSVMPLAFGIPVTSASANQDAPSDQIESDCTVGGLDMTALAPTTDATRIGIAVFHPRRPGIWHQLSFWFSSTQGAPFAMKRYVLIFFLLALGTGLIPAAQPVAAAPMAAPPSGWVQAQVVGGGCDAQGHCSSSVRPGSPTLYEYKPDRQSVGRDFAVGSDKSQHGGYVTYVKRDKCHIGNVDYYWSKGIWHHGGYWTLSFDAQGREKWSGPTNQHWAFEHNDVCEPLPTPIPTATPPPPPPGAPTYTPVPPTAIPTATPAPVCSNSYGQFDQRGNLKIAVPGVQAQEYAYDAQLPNAQGQLFPISYLYGPSLTNLPPYGLPEQHVAPGLPLTIGYRFGTLEAQPIDRNSYDVNHPGQAHVLFGLRDDTTGQLLLGSDTTDRKELKNSKGEVKLWDRTLQLKTTTVAPGLTFGGATMFSKWDKFHSPYWRDETNVPAANLYMRHLGLLNVQFTPQPEHTYTVFTWNGHGHCKVEAPRWTIARFIATTRPIQTPTPAIVPTATATPAPTLTPTPLPPVPPAPNATFDISIHSTLDPNSSDSDPRNGVYESSGDTISWPAGEVLDFTPRVQISVPQPSYTGYRVQAHVQDWSYVSSLNQRAATSTDSMGRQGCRGNGRMTSGASGPVCTYGYLGGASLSDSTQPTDADMASQAHVYWAPSAPRSMRPDVYVYALGQLQPVDLKVEVRIVVEVVNVATGTVVASNTQTASSTFQVNLVVPRSAK